MKRWGSRGTVLVLICLLTAGDTSAIGRRGGGGRSFGGGRSRGGFSGSRGGFSGSRGGFSGSRGSVPHLGGSSRPSYSRPSYSRPSYSRPSYSRPSTSRPSYSRPSTLPSSPSLGGSYSGGLRPSNRPSTLPSRPSTGGTRPGISLPDRPGTGQRPGLPGSGGSTNRPGFERPGAGQRPSIPSFGGGTGNRPGNSLPNRPGTGGVGQPGISRPGIDRPGAGGRPSPGDLGDFLGMDRPLRPDNGLRPDTRPGGGDRLRPDNGLRPDRDNNIIGNRDNNIIGNRDVDRSVNIGQIRIGDNNVISQRPTWANLDRNRITNINNRWQNQIGGIRNWPARYPNRIAGWRNWGNGIRHGWSHFHNHRGWFTAGWWAGHRHAWAGWHYGYRFGRYRWGYWWRVPTFAACVGWFAWNPQPAVWSEPVYYDYGTGGNVVYQDNSVYINNEQVATAEEFAQSAADLATVEPPASEEEAEKAEWMPLGTFAVSTSQKDVDPTRVVQLAVNKQGIVSGTLYNTTTDKAQSIQGQVDRNTQRVAFRIGESQDVVVETGLYNLTQDDVPLLVHMGPKKVENWLLVRLEDPDAEDEENSISAGGDSTPGQ